MEHTVEGFWVECQRLDADYDVKFMGDLVKFGRPRSPLAMINLIRGRIGLLNQEITNCTQKIAVFYQHGAGNKTMAEVEKFVAPQKKKLDLDLTTYSEMLAVLYNYYQKIDDSRKMAA